MQHMEELLCEEIQFLWLFYLISSVPLPLPELYPFFRNPKRAGKYVLHLMLGLGKSTPKDCLSIITGCLLHLFYFVLPAVRT